MPRHIVCLTFDFDTMSGFIARGLTTPTPLSRGEFGARASARILDFLEQRGIRSTWFVPGFTIESFPRECEAVVTAGHEIAHHGWAHVPPAELSREAEEADLVRANAAILRLTGQKARGYRSPSWDLSAHTIGLLVEHGFLYDSSMMGADYWPYRARCGDVAALGEPYRFGAETSLIEMPISWSLDDYPHFEFVRAPHTILLGDSHLHDAPLRHRPRLSHAGSRGISRPARQGRCGVHDHGGRCTRGVSAHVGVSVQHRPSLVIPGRASSFARTRNPAARDRPSGFRVRCCAPPRNDGAGTGAAGMLALAPAPLRV